MFISCYHVLDWEFPMLTACRGFIQGICSSTSTITSSRCLDWLSRYFFCHCHFPLGPTFFFNIRFSIFCYFGCGDVMVSGFPRMELDDYKAEGVSVDAGLSFNDNSDIVTLIDSKGTDGWWVCLLFFEFYKEHHLDDSAWNCSYSLCDLEQGH